MSRKKAEDFLINEVISKMPNAKLNVALYKASFKSMTDEQHKNIVARIKEQKYYFPIFVPNMSDESVNVEEVMALGEVLGIEWFQHLTLTDHVSGELYTTPTKYLVLDLPMRRQIQHLIEKLSTAESSRIVDHLAGQATGASKAASVSLPELVVLGGKGLQKSQLELVKVRGGDAKAYDMMNKSIEETGGWSLGPIMEAGSKPKAVETLNSLLLGIHIDSNLTRD